MSRPDFPRPYTPLTSGMISRINEEQRYYDEDPERAEAEQRAQAEREAEEQEHMRYMEENNYWNNQ